MLSLRLERRGAACGQADHPAQVAAHSTPRRRSKRQPTGAICQIGDQPQPDCACEARRRIGYYPLRIDSGDQGIARNAATLRRLNQKVPEDRFKTDRRLVTSNLDRIFFRRVVEIAHAPGVQYMCCPPLMLMVEPVTKAASSAVRKATPRAISSAWPSRPTGTPATIFSSTFSGTAATMSVSI